MVILLWGLFCANIERLLSGQSILNGGDSVSTEEKALRKMIIEEKDWFSISNINFRASMMGITDNKLISSVLDDLFQEGVIRYEEITPPPKDPTMAKWAFHVV